MGPHIRAVRDTCGIVRVWPSESVDDQLRLQLHVESRGGPAREPLPSYGRCVFSPTEQKVVVDVTDGDGRVLETRSLPVGRYAQSPGVLVVGSCVSRDLIPFGSEELTVTTYCARQSLISAFSSPMPPPADVALLSSPFQRRTMEEDYRSSVPNRVREAAPSADLLVWDLVDERLGVFVHAGGEITTATVEWYALHPDGAAPLGARHVPFGSLEHVALFRAALQRWRDLLAETGLVSRTVLLAPRWAEKTTSGQPTPKSFGVAAAHANEATLTYVRLIREVVGVEVIGLEVDTRAGEDHQWGLAPFHFDDETERLLVKRLEACLGRTPKLGVVARSSSGRLETSVGPGKKGALLVAAVPRSAAQVAFHLYQRRKRLTTTPYGTRHAYTFADLARGRYIVRTFARFVDGTQESFAVPVDVR